MQENIYNPEKAKKMYVFLEKYQLTWQRYGILTYKNDITCYIKNIVFCSLCNNNYVTYYMYK